jgi:hypothetical protein
MLGIIRRNNLRLRVRLREERGKKLRSGGLRVTCKDPELTSNREVNKSSE